MSILPITIPFNKPTLMGREQDYMAEALQLGHISGDGIFTRRCHALLEQTLEIPRALLTTSCTHALEMSALLLGIQPGDEVIVPSFTFVSTANAFALRGASIIFADIRPDTLNIDEAQLEELISKKTKAIVVVHYGGIACEMDYILKLARTYNIAVIEDNAHGLFARYKGQYLGTFGEFATQSFHETKNFSCGEGGALLINNPAYIERAEILREKGTNRSCFYRGQVDKYSWVDLGSSYLPSDLLAAFLLAQLEARDTITNKRRHVWDRYQFELTDWAQENEVQQPVIPADCEPPYHLYHLLMPSLDSRQRLISHLRGSGILSVFHYVPLHRSEMGLKAGAAPLGCPITDMVSDRLLRLPLYNSLTDSEQDYVIQEVKRFRVGNAPL